MNIIKTPEQQNYSPFTFINNKLMCVTPVSQVITLISVGW